LHETSFAIIIGFLFSLSAELYGNERFVNMMHFDDSLFFYICLPPIILATGFNMKKKNFFQNIGYVLLFGVFGTFVCFTTMSLLNGFVFYWIEMKKYNGLTGEWSSFDLSLKENLLLSSVICSSDIIAAVSLISADEHPKLAGIIFGEGIINDAVAIVLYKTVHIYTQPNEVFSTVTPLKVIVNFIQMSIFSMLLGVLVGVGKS
jgi:NhaP-type Na+/H+ or K+/H+ antiporter